MKLNFNQCLTIRVAWSTCVYLVSCIGHVDCVSVEKRAGTLMIKVATDNEPFDLEVIAFWYGIFQDHNFSKNFKKCTVSREWMFAFWISLSCRLVPVLYYT